jgi:hypothetical protein
MAGPSAMIAEALRMETLRKKNEQVNACQQYPLRVCAAPTTGLALSAKGRRNGGKQN